MITAKPRNRLTIIFPRLGSEAIICSLPVSVIARKVHADRTGMMPYGSGTDKSVNQNMPPVRKSSGNISSPFLSPKNMLMKIGADASGAMRLESGLQSYFLNNALVCIMYFCCWAWSTLSPSVSSWFLSAVSSGCMCAIRDEFLWAFTKSGKSRVRNAMVVAPMAYA